MRPLAASSVDTVLQDYQPRILRRYLWITTALHVAGFVLPPMVGLPIRPETVAARTAGVLLGLFALVVLYRGGRRPSRRSYRICTAATLLATPIVMSGLVLAVAQLLCAIAAMFLAMYFVVFYPKLQSRLLVGCLTALMVVAVAVAPSALTLVPVDVNAVTVKAAVLVVGVACVLGAAEMFGSLTRTLIESASTDALTALLNRAGFELAFRHALESAGTGRVSVALALIDVDQFKSTNDHYGHAAGDAVLVDLANYLSASMPRGALLARVGGDEFVCCVVGEHHAELPAVIARLARQCPTPFSFGTASSTGEPDPLTTLYRHADRALYVAKQRQRPPEPPADDPWLRTGWNV
ncbi:GGDEF domain-containing protein [Rhodococcus jostii]|uniref:Diguanylate cyclase (GGDEF) domain-containing protein n=1 Tax=Rhodococcus jostii TaxID=132919 RepID=A0A1H5CRF9_RHOJO|nr:GGDEF domain-containing protein [Rhodococcus jostii]SED69257.1 diguanylate cyclase (GGDEF) domain-containing protein [Rhodococcus jostii]